MNWLKIGAVALTITALGAPGSALGCKVINISYEFDDGPTSVGNGIVSIEITTNQTDVQRSVSGYLIIYYKYVDRDGLIAKNSTFDNIFEDIPEGESVTSHQVKIPGVFIDFQNNARITEVYDIKFMGLVCRRSV